MGHEMFGHPHSYVTQQSLCRTSTKTESSGQEYGWVGQSHVTDTHGPMAAMSTGWWHISGESAVEIVVKRRYWMMVD